MPFQGLHKRSYNWGSRENVPFEPHNDLTCLYYIINYSACIHDIAGQAQSIRRVRDQEHTYLRLCPNHQLKLLSHWKRSQSQFLQQTQTVTHPVKTMVCKLFIMDNQNKTHEKESTNITKIGKERGNFYQKIKRSPDERHAQTHRSLIVTSKLPCVSVYHSSGDLFIVW